MTIEAGSSGVRNHHRDFKTPTDKQLAALDRYQDDPSIPAPVRDGIRMHLSGNRMTYATAWDTIAMIKAYHRSQSPKATPVSETGIYVDPTNNGFFLVKKSQMGKLYAMELILHNLGEKNPDGTWKTKPEFEWVFQAGKSQVFKLKAEWRATEAQLKEWGDLTGHCMKCFTELTKQESIDRGMGSVCWKKQFGG